MKRALKDLHKEMGMDRERDIFCKCIRSVVLKMSHYYHLYGYVCNEIHKRMYTTLHFPLIGVKKSVKFSSKAMLITENLL